jgi:hypothetical protein
MKPQSSQKSSVLEQIKSLQTTSEKDYGAPAQMPWLPRRGVEAENPIEAVRAIKKQTKMDKP